MRFELNYQANLAAWGASACLRLWRITKRDYYKRQGCVYLASLFNDREIWESEIANTRHYRNFLGATCLHDAPYMAIYECFDSFAAFERYLKDSVPDLDPSARLPISEYCRHALDRAWFYYPDALPAAVLATEIRNGHIDRTLSFPLEDLYADGQPAGQGGQEIYGAGAAFVFASCSFHAVEAAPFRIFCDHFPVTSERTSEWSLSFGIDGGAARCHRSALFGCPANVLPVSLSERQVKKRSGRAIGAQTGSIVSFLQAGRLCSRGEERMLLGIIAHIAFELFPVPLADPRLLIGREVLLQFGKPGALLRINMMENGAANMLELVAIILAHRVQPFEQTQFHLGGGLFLVCKFGVPNLVVSRQRRIQRRLLGDRVAGQDRPELLLCGRAFTRVGCSRDGIERSFDLAMMIENL